MRKRPTFMQSERDSQGHITSSSLKLDYTELEKAFTPNTRMIFINNPHNPCGKVRFTLDF